MSLIGEVKDVIYSNPLNGYSVVEVVCDGAKYTAVGTFPPVHEGEILNMEGDWTTHKGYGKQFAVTNVKVSMPTSQDAMKKYLSSGLIKGLGESTAASIVNMYGTNSFEAMYHPIQLTKIKGISLKKATEFGVQFQKIKTMQEAIMFLQKFSVSINLALKIYKAYESSTETVIKHNPYKLVEDIDGVGFHTADKLAQEMGIAPDSDYRISAAVTHLLKEAVTQQGHTYLPFDSLVAGAKELLNYPEDLTDRIGSAITDLSFTGDVRIEELADHRAVALSRNYETEKSIARRMVRLLEECSDISTDADDDIKRFEDESGLILHGKQRDAVRNAVSHGVHIITGGPGTGKTTIIKAVIHVIKNLRLTFALCAPTGRAAKRLQEASGEDAKTIHRLLDIDFSGGRGRTTFGESKVAADVVIVDEVSMADEYVFNALIKSLEHGTRLILVGDKDQLPSVGAGNVLADLIACGRFGVTYLTEIYRQEKESSIVINAHAINNGRMFKTDNSSDDFFFRETNDPSEVLAIATEMCLTRLPKFLGMRPQDIQILCPMKKGIAGVNNLNKTVQDRINPAKPNGKEIRNGELVFREGDKVMQTVNNYQQEWSVIKDVRIEYGVGVYNGDVGYIERINNSNLEFTVRFDDDKVAVYSFSDIDQLTLSYAVSIHKSQGSEFDAAIIAVTNAPPMLLTRNLLYTAVTRAKKLVVLVGPSSVFERMVKNNYTANRYTLLQNMFLLGI
ncbi:MAG: ATP-dependent RecD-like DNA helicase [Clostridiaceae bacterium]|jgi:exodeoxyribonuclease V alpha subunit|nr:ATP-dependent RecD-like DNA helicase [Clostridiaceae bacterium]